MDVFALWGGEEFIALSSYTDPENTGLLAEKLRTVIERNRFDVIHRITCSFGVAQFAERDTPESFTMRTDAALYRRKKKEETGL